jgi:hypothetical protein
MLFKYTEFISESYLILESNVIFSDKIRKVLSKIDLPISKDILDLENKDIDVSSNYFDIIHDKNDKVSFIPDRKAQEILNDTKVYVKFIGNDGGWLKHKDVNSEIFKSLGYEPEGDPYKPSNSEVGEIISKITSDKSGKTYAYVKFENGESVYNLDKLRIFDNISKNVWIKNRQEINIGRAFRALLTSSGKKVVDKDIELFVNKFKSVVDKLNDRFSDFDLVKGGDIAYWYNCDNYKKRSGTLGNSCMSDVDDAFFDIYVSNPDVCNLLILKAKDDSDKIIGRALLWTLRSGVKFLDRIYTVDDSDVNLFRDYAKEMGWYSKYYNGSSAESIVYDLNGNMSSLPNFLVDIRKGYYEQYPYLDTFKYWDKDNGILTIERGGGADYTLESTDGYYIYCDRCEGNGRVECDECNGDGRVECGECDGDGRVKCSECDGDGRIEDSDGNSEDCYNCDGDGRVSCDNCDGDGRVSCDNCDDGRVDCYSCN